MRVVVEARVEVPQAPRHPEVYEQSATGIEPDNQILAATVDRCDPFALELRRHLGGLVRADEPRIVDLHALESASLENRCKTHANRLDLG